MAMNRDERGRLLPGSGGRQPGSRNKLQAEFLDELAKDFAENGAGVIRVVRVERPSEYLKIIASVLPKEWLVSESSPLSELTDEELVQFIASARAGKRAA